MDFGRVRLGLLAPMPARTRLRDAGRVVARRLAVEVLDRVARTAERLAHRLGIEAPRPLRAAQHDSWAGAVVVETHPQPVATTPTPTRPESIARAAPADPEPAARSDADDGEAAETAGPAEPAGPAGPRPTVAWALVEVLGRRAAPALADLRAELDPCAPGDREALHQLRVATRRLRAFTEIFAPVLGAKRARQLRRRLRQITRTAGEVRQWDAHLELIAPVLEAADAPIERAALEHVVEWVHGQREEAASAVTSSLRVSRRRKLAGRLDAAIDEVAARLLREGEAAGPLARAWAADALRSAAERSGALVLVEDVERLHGVRIAAKRARYALELLRPALDEHYRAMRRPAKRAQQAIGLHHDAALLERLLAERRDALVAHGSATLARALDDLVARTAVRRRAAYERARPWAERWTADRVRRDADLLSPPPPIAPTAPAADPGA